MRNFDSWKYEEVEDTFGIKEVAQMPLFTEWLTSSTKTEENLLFLLEQLKNRIRKEAKNWQEDELKMLFIGPLISLANLETEYFKPFTQRSYSVVVNGVEIGGRIDFMIAKGKQTPKQPYFCLHEYKQEENPKGDAFGQLLVAMIAAQAKNDKEMPILGIYVVGRNWFFVILNGKEYAVSNEYNASDDDIFQIFAILQKSKEIMLRYV